jgi:hypothetical protein
MATIEPSSPAVPTAPAAKTAASWARAAGVLAAAVGFVTAAYATAFAIAYFVPEENDYALTARVQHLALTTPAGKKIVLIGGSNLTYGAVSPEIEAATGCPVANLGLNGRLGAGFMLAQAEHNLHAGDIAVIAFEYDTFLLSSQGDAQGQFVVAKTEPATLGYMTWRQKFAAAMAVPQIAQLKILGGMGRFYDGIADPSSLIPGPMAGIESVKSITANGDLVAHIGVTWPYDYEDGFDFTNQPVNPDVIADIQGFAERMQHRGVHVLLSYTPVMRSYYERHHEALERLHDTLAATPPLDPPSRPSDFVFDEKYFFDTVYHLNGEGRLIRTEKLIGDLVHQMGDEALCRPKAENAIQGGIADD